MSWMQSSPRPKHAPLHLQRHGTASCRQMNVRYADPAGMCQGWHVRSAPTCTRSLGVSLWTPNGVTRSWQSAIGGRSSLNLTSSRRPALSGFSRYLRMIGKWLNESSCCRQRCLITGGVHRRRMLLNPRYFVFEVSGNQLLSQLIRTHAAKRSNTGNSCLPTAITQGNQKGSADRIPHRGRKSALTAVQSHDFSDDSSSCPALLGRALRSRFQVTFLGCGHRLESSGTTFTMSISVTHSSLRGLAHACALGPVRHHTPIDRRYPPGCAFSAQPFIHIRVTNTLDLSPK